jgi:hypothetical protein
MPKAVIHPIVARRFHTDRTNNEAERGWTTDLVGKTSNILFDIMQLLGHSISGCLWWEASE